MPIPKELAELIESTKPGDIASAVEAVPKLRELFGALGIDAAAEPAGAAPQGNKPAPSGEPASPPDKPKAQPKPPDSTRGTFASLGGSLFTAAILPAATTGTLADLYRSSPAPSEGAGPQGSASDEQQARKFGTLDKVKLGLDVAGIFDPTGIADLTSGAISLGQGVHALATGQEGAADHFVDAGISAVSALPFGDIAKAGKLRHLRHLEAFKPAAKSYKRQRTEERLGPFGSVLSMLDGGGPAGGSAPAGMGGNTPDIKAGGGGTFVASGPTTLTVGDAPDPELVTVTPLGRKGTTTVSGSHASFGGGGSLIAGGAEGRVITEGFDAGANIARDALAGDFKALSVELVRLPSLLHDWADELVRSRGALAEISAPQAYIAARREVREIQRGIRSGEATAGSTDNLSTALDDLRDEMQPIRDAITNLVQNAITPLIKSLDTAVEYVKAFVESGGDLTETRRTVDLDRKVRANQEKYQMAFGGSMFESFRQEFEQRMREEEKRRRKF